MKMIIGIFSTTLNVVGTLILCVGLTFLFWSIQDYEFGMTWILAPVITGIAMSAIGGAVVLTARRSLSGYFHDTVAAVVVGFYGVSMGPLDWTVGVISIAVAAILATRHLIFGTAAAT